MHAGVGMRVCRCVIYSYGGVGGSSGKNYIFTKSITSYFFILYHLLPC